MASSSTFMSTIDKLDGRENFNTWQFAVEAYLAHEGLWNCVLGTELNAEKNIKAKSKLILLVKPINFVHIQTCTTAQQIWEKLQTTFADSGLMRRVNLIRVLTSTKLEDCLNVEDYVNIVLSAAHKLNVIGGNNVSDEWIGTFLLAGLPDVYKPMIMAIESSGVTITSDMVKTKLLQDIKTYSNVHSSNDMALFISKRSNSQSNGRGPRCYACDEHGHIAVYCPKKKYGSTSNASTKYSDIGTSGASEKRDQVKSNYAGGNGFFTGCVRGVQGVKGQINSSGLFNSGTSTNKSKRKTSVSHSVVCLDDDFWLNGNLNSSSGGNSSGTLNSSSEGNKIDNLDLNSEGHGSANLNLNSVGQVQVSSSDLTLLNYNSSDSGDEDSDFNGF